MSGKAALQANSDRHFTASWNESITARKCFSNTDAETKQYIYSKVLPQRLFKKRLLNYQDYLLVQNQLISTYLSCGINTNLQVISLDGRKEIIHKTEFPNQPCVKTSMLFICMFLSEKCYAMSLLIIQNVLQNIWCAWMLCYINRVSYIGPLTYARTYKWFCR